MGVGARFRDPRRARRLSTAPVPCPLKVSIHSVWLGNSITPLREEEWDEEEEETEAPAPSSPPTSPINSRFPPPSVQASGSSVQSLVWGPLDEPLISFGGNCRKHRAGVDIHSCSQFLLELYSRWILPSSSARRTPVTLISEVVRSVSGVPTPVVPGARAETPEGCGASQARGGPTPRTVPGRHAPAQWPHRGVGTGPPVLTALSPQACDRHTPPAAKHLSGRLLSGGWPQSPSCPGAPRGRQGV